MNDSHRTTLFGRPFGTSFHPSCTSRFEFVDIFVETRADLNRHMDYQNGKCENYDFGASYSFLILTRDVDAPEISRAFW